MDIQQVTSNEPRRKVMVIDSKSFYASVESVDRGLNPLTSLLIVMSQQKNTNGGLVLAASPRAKRELGVKNVIRQRDVPFDESILDVTDTWEYLKFVYGKDLTLKKLARIIQLKVKQALGLYLTVGIGDTPVMAKLALDIQAKHDFNLIGEWHFETIPKHLWSIIKLDDVWSIGKRTAKSLMRLGILSMRDLALANPYYLKQKLGVRGEELFALAWGVDRSILRHRHYIKDGNVSNSQVLPRDYNRVDEIKVVIREIGEQVAARLRAKNEAAGTISLFVGYSYATSEMKHSHGFHVQTKIIPSNQSDIISSALIQLFDDHFEGGNVRNLGVAAGKLQPAGYDQLDLLTPVKQQLNASKIDQVIDEIRQKFGVTSLVKLSSLNQGGTMIQRAGLVGGHNCGNAYG